MATFLINSEEKELVYRSNGGVDYTNDVIGNTCHGMDIDDEGRFVATQDDYDWWQTYFDDDVKLMGIVAEYKDKYGDEKVESFLQETSAYAVDMEDIYSSVTHQLAELNHCQ